MSKYYPHLTQPGSTNYSMSELLERLQDDLGYPPPISYVSKVENIINTCNNQGSATLVEEEKRILNWINQCNLQNGAKNTIQPGNTMRL